jgi:hypothetical protein
MDDVELTRRDDNSELRHARSEHAFDKMLAYRPRVLDRAIEPAADG